VVALSASTGSGSRDSIAIDNFSLFSSAGAGTGSGTIGVVNTPGMAVYSGNLTIHGAATLSAGVGNATFSGNFSGAGNVTKSGTGTVILTGNAAHTGGTTVSDGTLRVNGTHGSAIAVSWATLGGNGTISGLTTLNSGATLAPGNSVGTLTFTSGLSLNSTSTVVMEINGTTAGQFDTVNVSGGSLTYAGSLQLVFGHTPAVNDSYQLFTGSAVAGAAGNFGTITFTGQPEYAGTFAPGTGTLTITAIPEPQTFALLGMAGCFLLWHLRRRKAASPPLLPEN
jgi:autotransporter-associated beta strand protein